MNQEKRHKIMTRLRESTSHSDITLDSLSPFEYLIFIILSAQANDISVQKATDRLYIVANTPTDILNLGLEPLKEYIRTIGLFHIKAKNIINTCRILLEKHHGNIPDKRKDLENLPGVGRKTANLVLNTVFGQPTIAVDRHVFRVCNRTRFAIGKNVKIVEKLLLRYVSQSLKLHCHHYLVLHGRYTCMARQPKCNSCIIVDLCEYNNKNNIYYH
ncbi:Endonuclease III [Candidatus Erwinia haradaeae]|uniref:Endonuclease III n=1 Tax=Candidatus Erwinia haradaeae TaxID=1922217 RepID=A0A451CZY7_9GAMM|nr:endonuclease III [Candidatus Erwinia haradaeae]VFP78760.1 Endonuclease III [Candidatus Erwinia haradaeae]